MLIKRINNAVQRRWDRLMARSMGTIVRVDTRKPQVALTFDDGPDPVDTPALLDILANKGAKATFFVVGEAAARQKQLIRRMVAEGHAIGSHGWNHTSFRQLSGIQRRDQLRRTRRLLDTLGGVRLFRPPFGHQSLASRLDAMMLGYQVVTWNILTEDWLDRDAEKMLQGLKARLRPGSIVLFHDRLYTFLNSAYRNRKQTLKAVSMLLESYHSHFEFVTVQTLLHGGKAVTKNWLRSPDAQWMGSLQRIND